jgi:hypothetical protein
VYFEQEFLFVVSCWVLKHEISQGLNGL